nr:hypothetical protein [Gammaproteobacteria bacterium]
LNNLKEQTESESKTAEIKTEASSEKSVVNKIAWLREKISELESEKTTLETQLATALASMEKSEAHGKAEADLEKAPPITLTEYSRIQELNDKVDAATNSIRYYQSYLEALLNPATHQKPYPPLLNIPTRAEQHAAAEQNRQQRIEGLQKEIAGLQIKKQLLEQKAEHLSLDLVGLFEAQANTATSSASAEIKVASSNATSIPELQTYMFLNEEQITQIENHIRACQTILTQLKNNGMPPLTTDKDTDSDTELTHEDTARSVTDFTELFAPLTDAERSSYGSIDTTTQPPLRAQKTDATDEFDDMPYKEISSGEKPNALESGKEEIITAITTLEVQRAALEAHLQPQPTDPDSKEEPVPENFATIFNQIAQINTEIETYKKELARLQQNPNQAKAAPKLPPRVSVNVEAFFNSTNSTSSTTEEPQPDSPSSRPA